MALTTVLQPLTSPLTFSHTGGGGEISVVHRKKLEFSMETAVEEFVDNVRVNEIPGRLRHCRSLVQETSIDTHFGRSSWTFGPWATGGGRKHRELFLSLPISIRPVVWHSFPVLRESRSSHTFILQPRPKLKG